MEIIDSSAYETAVSKGALTVDIRPAAVFCDGFYPGSLSVPLSADWLSVIAQCTSGEGPIVLLAAKNQLDELRLSAAELQHRIAGVFIPDENFWNNVPQRGFIVSIDADEFLLDYRHDEFFLVDVRSADAYGKLHLEDAESVPVADLETIIADMDEAMKIYLYGTDAAEATTAASIFKQNGFENVRVVMASFDELSALDVPFSGTNRKKVDITPSPN